MGKISYVLRCLITLVEKEDKIRPVREGEVAQEEDETEEIELGCATMHHAPPFRNTTAHALLGLQVLPLGHCHECRGASVHYCMANQARPNSHPACLCDSS